MANSEEKMTMAQDVEFVSVVIPCYNEERYIGKALEQLADQLEPHRYEIIVVDGMSSDRTRIVIEQFAQTRKTLSVVVIDNPARKIPTALNLGIAASRGSIIARMDAHAVPSEGYIRGCLEALKSPSVGAVGMPCRVRAGDDTIMAQTIATAVSHSFGIGDATYRLSSGKTEREPVDTVAFACFRKKVWEDLGGFNESLLANEDYEFNYRIRQSGLQVILDRSGYCDYFARTRLNSLASQYRRYGSWKAQMIKLRPQSIRLRHVVAPLFVLSIIFLTLGGIVWRPLLWLLLVELAVYLSVALIAAFTATKTIKRNRPSVVLLLPLVFTTIHLTWGTSFLLGLLENKGTKQTAF